jgi:hypothetical protein
MTREYPLEKLRKLGLLRILMQAKPQPLSEFFSIQGKPIELAQWMMVQPLLTGWNRNGNGGSPLFPQYTTSMAGLSNQFN